MFLIKLILGISTEGYNQFNLKKPQLDLRTSNDVKFWLLSYRFWTSIKLKLNSKLQIFLINLILVIWTEGYYQFDMTKPQLYLRTLNDVKFWLLSYWFRTLTKLKLNSKLQTHIRHIDQGILPVRYDKAKAGSENIERCQILTPLIPVSEFDQTQTQLKIANVSNQTHIRHIDRGILPVWYDKATTGSENTKEC